MGLALALIHLALQVKAGAIHASTPGPGRVGLGGEIIQVVALGDDDRHGAAGLDATPSAGVQYATDLRPRTHQGERSERLSATDRGRRRALDDRLGQHQLRRRQPAQAVDTIHQEQASAPASLQ